MSQFEFRSNANSPFKVDLCCNVNIEVHVAMRLGELIKASRTEDKQLMALGHRLSSAMMHLVEKLDDRQWDRLYSQMEEQAQDDASHDREGLAENDYVSKARESFPRGWDEYKNSSSAREPMAMKDYVSSYVSKKE